MSLRTQRQSLKLLNCIISKMNEKSSSRIVTVTSSCVNVEYFLAVVCIYGPFGRCRTKYNTYFDSTTGVSTIEKRKLEEKESISLRIFT